MNYPIRSLLLLALAVQLTFGTVDNSRASDDGIVTLKIEGDFFDVSANIRAAIVGKGINISNTVHASQMLNRTGRDFGYSDNVYVDAEMYEFCSARLSHKLARLNPDNIVMCPFTISVYVVTKEPDLVRITYRVPTGKPGSEEISEEIRTLIEDIIEEATW